MCTRRRGRGGAVERPAILEVAGRELNSAFTRSDARPTSRTRARRRSRDPPVSGEMPSREPVAPVDQDAQRSATTVTGDPRIRRRPIRASAPSTRGSPPATPCACAARLGARTGVAVGDDAEPARFEGPANRAIAKDADTPRRSNPRPPRRDASRPVARRRSRAPGSRTPPCAAPPGTARRATGASPAVHQHAQQTTASKDRHRTRGRGVTVHEGPRPRHAAPPPRRATASISFDASTPGNHRASPAARWRRGPCRCDVEHRGDRWGQEPGITGRAAATAADGAEASPAKAAAGDGRRDRVTVAAGAERARDPPGHLRGHLAAQMGTGEAGPGEIRDS